MLYVPVYVRCECIMAHVVDANLFQHVEKFPKQISFRFIMLKCVYVTSIYLFETNTGGNICFAKHVLYVLFEKIAHTIGHNLTEQKKLLNNSVFTKSTHKFSRQVHLITFGVLFSCTKCSFENVKNCWYASSTLHLANTDISFQHFLHLQINDS